ncbi:hypothetical protein V8C26DRAFT_393952 [Trichoderma gracile]
MQSLMATKPNTMSPLTMTLAPQYGKRGTWSSQLRMAFAVPPKAFTETDNDVEVEMDLEQDQADSPNESGVTEISRPTSLRAMDRLVQDLLASQKNLEDEKRKADAKDAEIARLREEVSQLQQRDCNDCEQMKELRRLLAFHKTNGEQVSSKFRELQAANRGLQAQLQATKSALEEQMALISGLGGFA